MKFYVGTSGYSYPKWKGPFYPAKLPAKDMLDYYAAHFGAVELNNTFRNLPSAAALEALAEEVPAPFRFAVKAPQKITHYRRLNNVAESVATFLEVAGALKKRLGPLLFQLPPNFKKDTARLRALFEMLPTGCRATLEFRHPSWFDKEVFGLLRDHGAALCIADISDELKVPFESTADWGYLRLRRDEYNDAALAAWAEKLAAQKWRDCYVFFKHEDTGIGPKLATRLMALLAAAPRPAAKSKSKSSK